jgi:hypothetical protein
VVKGGVCIDVGAEAYSVFFQILDQSFLGEVLGAIEGHVFQKVS